MLYISRPRTKMSRGGGDENDDNLFDNDYAGIGHVTGWDENRRGGHEDRIEGSRIGTPQHEAAKVRRLVSVSDCCLGFGVQGLQLVSDETGIYGWRWPQEEDAGRKGEGSRGRTSVGRTGLGRIKECKGIGRI